MVGFKSLAGLFLAALGAAAPAASSGKYIITLKEGTSAATAESHIQWVNGVHERSLGRRDLDLAGLEKTYEIGSFSGYAGNFDAATIEQIRNNPDVCFPHLPRPHLHLSHSFSITLEIKRRRQRGEWM